MKVVLDFLGFGRNVIMPEEGFVEEQGDLGGRIIIKLSSAREGPIEQISAGVFYQIWELVIHILVKTRGTKYSTKGE